MPRIELQTNKSPLVDPTGWNTWQNPVSYAETASPMGGNRNRWTDCLQPHWHLGTTYGHLSTMKQWKQRHQSHISHTC
jgi:hypothetical protein